MIWSQGSLRFYFIWVSEVRWKGNSDNVFPLGRFEDAVRRSESEKTRGEIVLDMGVEGTKVVSQCGWSANLEHGKLHFDKQFVYYNYSFHIIHKTGNAKPKSVKEKDQY